MKFKSVESAVEFLENLGATRGYNVASTAEWRRISMKFSDCALIQFARRLASRLETEKPFLVGVDEQDFNPKIHVVDGDNYCPLCLTKEVDERTGEVKYALGHADNQISGRLINVSKPPTEEDFRYAVRVIESASLEITRTKPGRRSSGK